MRSTGVWSTPTRWPVSTRTIRRSTTKIGPRSRCWPSMTCPCCASSALRILCGSGTMGGEKVYHQFGGSIPGIMKEGVAHPPHSLMDPTPIADWIEQHMHTVEANRPAVAASTSTKAHYYSLENSLVYLKEEDTYATVRGPGSVPSYDRYDGPGTGSFQ